MIAIIAVRLSLFVNHLVGELSVGASSYQSCMLIVTFLGTELRCCLFNIFCRLVPSNYSRPVTDWLTLALGVQVVH